MGPPATGHLKPVLQPRKTLLPVLPGHQKRPTSLKQVLTLAGILLPTLIETQLLMKSHGLKTKPLLHGLQNQQQVPIILSLDYLKKLVIW